VLVGDVVGDDVDDGADPELQRLGDERLRLLEGAELRVDPAVVGDVVPTIGERRDVPGREPDRVDTELAEVRESGTDAREVTRAVAVPVREAADVDLVDDGAAPPLRVVARRGDPVPRRLAGTLACAVLLEHAALPSCDIPPRVVKGN
jgi:hypothetical protein